MGLLGQALTDKLNGNQTEPLLVHCDRAADEVMSTAQFFNRFPEFHRVERVAMARCKGRVLDLGAGAGRHSLELMHRGLITTAVDSDPLLERLMRRRGVAEVVCSTWQELDLPAAYDTVLVLMNGVGLCGRKADFGAYIYKMKSLLAPGGILLMDSSSVDYLPEPKPGIEREEVVFSFSYKGEREAPFFWYFAEEANLLKDLSAAGFEARCVYRHQDGRFLIEATLPKDA